MRKKLNTLALLFLFSISLCLILPTANHLVYADSGSTVTYSGNFSLTTSVTDAGDYDYPGQAMSRTCVVSCSFSDFTLSSYDNGLTYSGSVTSQATYTSDWTMNPPTITNSQSSTRTFSPSSDHLSTTDSLQIYAEIKGGVLTFIFSYNYIPSPTQIDLTYTLTDPTHTTPFSAHTSFTSPTVDAANALGYSTQEGSGVTVPKSTNPMQSQTISFSGGHSGSNVQSFSWTGTITLNVGNQATAEPTAEPPTPTPTSSSAPFMWDWDSGYWSGTAYVTDADGEENLMTGNSSIEVGTKIRTTDSPVDITMPHASGVANLKPNSELHFIGIQQETTSSGSLHLTAVPLPDWVHMSKYDEEGLVNEGLGPLSILLGNAPGPNTPAIPMFYFLYQGAVYVNDNLDIPLPDWAYEEDQNPVTVPVAIPDGVVVPKGTAYSISVAADGSSVIEVSDGSVIFLDPITANKVTVSANQRLTLSAPTQNGFTTQQLQNAVSSNSSSVTYIIIIVVVVAIIAIVCSFVLLKRRKRQLLTTPPPPPPPPPQ